MALSLATGADLKTTALTFVKRQSVTADLNAIAVWLELAEAELNRELGPIESEAALTGSVGSRILSLSGLSIIEPLRLWWKLSSTVNETELTLQPSENFALAAANAPPRSWMMNNQSEIWLDSPLNDASYTFRFRYRGPFALTDGGTNWLLTYHPDVYLAAVLAWGGVYDLDNETLAKHQAILDRKLPQVKHTLAQAKRGTLQVDFALVGRRRAYNINSDQ